jgi:KaiC/GvpD/RAD55 family RecA-like ATPase
LIALDEHLHGFERGNLVTLSAPSSGGKSTMATVMSINQYLRSNHNVCYVSLEMNENELLRRIVSNISKIEHDKIRVTKYLTKAERQNAGKAFKLWHQHGKASNCCYTIWNPRDTSFTPQKLETSLAPLMYDIIIVDYITLMDSRGLDTWKMQMEYSRYLSVVAKRLNCVVVVLSQLSDDERIKYGRAILENTDYWLWWPYGEEEEETGNVELRLAKARHGRRARIQAKFMLDIMSIETAAVAQQSARRSKGEALGAKSAIWTNA